MGDNAYKSISKLLQQHQDITIGSNDPSYEAFVQALQDYAMGYHNDHIKCLLWIEKTKGVRSFYPISDVLKLGVRQVLINAYNLNSNPYSDNELTLNDIEIPKPLSIGVHFYKQERSNLHKINTREYTFHSGGYFPFINKSLLDLSPFQINKRVKLDDMYCFCYAMQQSKLFKDNEIDTLQRIIQIRCLPRKVIKHICYKFKVNITVKEKGRNHKCFVDNARGTIVLYLLYNHYMLSQSYDKYGNVIVDLTIKHCRLSRLINMLLHHNLMNAINRNTLSMLNNT
jgi:hypothetical protein